MSQGGIRMNDTRNTLLWRCIITGIIVVGFFVLYFQNIQNYRIQMQWKSEINDNVIKVYDKIDTARASIEEEFKKTLRVFGETKQEVRKIDGYKRTVDVMISTIPKKVASNGRVLYQIGTKEYELNRVGNRYEALIQLDMDLLKEQELLVLEVNNVRQMEVIEEEDLEITIGDQIMYNIYAESLGQIWERENNEIVWNEKVTYGSDSLIDTIQSATYYIKEMGHQTIWSQDIEVKSNEQMTVKMNARIPDSTKTMQTYLEVKTKSGLIYHQYFIQHTFYEEAGDIREDYINLETEDYINEVFDANGKKIELQKVTN